MNAFGLTGRRTPAPARPDAMVNAQTQADSAEAEAISVYLRFRGGEAPA